MTANKLQEVLLMDLLITKSFGFDLVLYLVTESGDVQPIYVQAILELVGMVKLRCDFVYDRNLNPILQHFDLIS